jgi:hypothetical protein
MARRRRRHRPVPSPYRCPSTSTRPRSSFRRVHSRAMVPPSPPTGPDRHRPRRQTARLTDHHRGPRRGRRHHNTSPGPSLHPRGHLRHHHHSTSPSRSPSHSTSRGQSHKSLSTSRDQSLSTSQGHSRPSPSRSTQGRRRQPGLSTGPLRPSPSSQRTSRHLLLPSLNSPPTEVATTTRGQRPNRTCPRSPTWTSLARRTS